MNALLLLSLAVLFNDPYDDTNETLLYCASPIVTSSSLILNGHDNNSYILNDINYQTTYTYRVDPIKIDWPGILVLSDERFSTSSIIKLPISNEDTRRLNRTVDSFTQYSKVSKYQLDHFKIYYLYASDESNNELHHDIPTTTVIETPLPIVLEYSLYLCSLKDTRGIIYIFMRLGWTDKLYVDVFNDKMKLLKSIQLKDSD